MLGRAVWRSLWSAGLVAVGVLVARRDTTAKDVSPQPAGQYSNSDRVALLGALYQAERADNSSIFTNALAIVGFGLAYIGAVLAYAGATTAPNGAVFAFAGTPACALMTYHAVMVGMNAARSASASRLESQIFNILQIESLTKQAEQKKSWTKPGFKSKDLTFGVNVGEEYLNFDKASRVRTAGSLATYGAVYAMILGFAVYTLYLSYTRGGGWWAIAGTVVDSAILLIAGWNLILDSKQPEIASAGKLLPSNEGRG